MHCLLCHSSHCAFYTAIILLLSSPIRETKLIVKLWSIVDVYSDFWNGNWTIGYLTPTISTNQKSTTDLRCFQLWCAEEGWIQHPRHRLRWADGMLLFGSTVTTLPWITACRSRSSSDELMKLAPDAKKWSLKNFRSSFQKGIVNLRCYCHQLSGQWIYVLIPLLWLVTQPSKFFSSMKCLQVMDCTLHVFPLLFCLRSMRHCRCSLMELHNVPHVATCDYDSISKVPAKRNS